MYRVLKQKDIYFSMENLCGIVKAVRRGEELFKEEEEKKGKKRETGWEKICHFHRESSSCSFPQFPSYFRKIWICRRAIGEYYVDVEDVSTDAMPIVKHLIWMCLWLEIAITVKASQGDTQFLIALDHEASFRNFDAQGKQKLERSQQFSND